MGDDVVLLQLSLNEETVRQVQNRVRNVVNALNNQQIRLNINTNGIDRVNSQLEQLNRRVQQLQNTNININSATLTTEQRQYQLENQRLAVLARIEQSRQRTLQTENNAVAALANEQRVLTHNLNLNQQINGEIQHTHNHVRNAGNAANNLANQFQRGLQTLIAYRVLNSIIRSISEAATELKNVDTEMVSIRKVTELTVNDMEKLRKSSFDVAENYSRSASHYLASTAAFAKAGYKDKMDELGELALLTENVSECENDLANKFLIASNASWKLNGDIEKLTAILDGCNAVTNKTEADFGALIEGVQVAGSVFSQAGLSAQDYVSLVSTVQANTQLSGKVVARGLRNVLLNIRQTKAAFDDGDVINEEDLAKSEKALKSIGISIRENIDGVSELKHPMIVLTELYNKWGSLSSVQQSTIQTALAGKYQSNIFTSLMENFDDVKKASDIYATSSGSAARENEYYLDSLDAKLQKVSNSWTSYINGMTDISLVKDGLDSVSTVINMLDTDVGRFASQIALLATSLNLLNRGFTWIQGLEHFRNINLSAEILRITAAELGLGAAARTLTSTLWEQATAWAATPVGMATLTIGSIYAITKLYDAITITQEEASESARNTAQKYEETKQEIESVNSELKTTQTRIKELESQGTLSLVEQDELTKLQSTNAELERELAIKKAIAELDGKEANDTAVEALTKKYRGVSPDATETLIFISGSSDFDRIDAVNAYISRVEELNKEIAILESEQATIDDANNPRFKEISNILDGTGLFLMPDGIRETKKEYEKLISDLMKEIETDAKGLIKGNEDADPILKRIKDMNDNYLLSQGEAGETNTNILNSLLDSEKLKTVKNELVEMASKGELTTEKLNKAGKIGTVSFDDISKAVNESNLVLEDGQDPLQVFVDYLKSIKSEGSGFSSNLTDLSAIIKEVEEKSSGLSKAYKEMSENGRLSLSTVKDLIEKYPELKDKIVSTSNGYTIEKSAIQESIDSMIQKYQLELEEAEKAALTTAKACDINVKGYNQVTDSIRDAVQAKLIWLSTPDNVVGMNFDEWSKEYKKYSDLSNSINEIIERRKALAGLKSTVSNDVFNKTAKKSEILKKQFDLLNHELEKFKDNLSILDKKLDMTFEGDYVDKLQTLSSQLETTAEYSASLRNEMDSLFSMTPSNAEEAEAIASQLESIGDSFFENQRKLIEYKKQMTEARVELIETMAEISSDSLDGLSSAVDYTLNALENGTLSGSVIKDPSYYSVTLSAVEKQRKENEELIAEEKRYREKIADIREKAIKMSLDEAEATSAKITKIVDETEKNVNDGMQGIVNDVQKAADDISKIEFKAPRLDNVSWGKTSEDIKKFSEKAQSVWDKSLTDKPGALSGGNDAVDYARTQLGKKYVWGGQSPNEGFDCSGLVIWALNQSGKNIGDTNAAGLYNNSKKITIDELQPGDLIFTEFGENGADHVGMYTENNTVISASKGSGKVIEREFSNYWRQGKFGRINTYSKGTKDFNVDEHSGIGAENGKKEYAIKKKTGEWFSITEPTLFDTREYDIVGEEETRKIDNRISTYAKGTIYPSKSGLGSTHSFTWFNEDGYLGPVLKYWDKDSASWQLFQKLLATGELTTDENGIYMYKGMRLAATTDKWGQVGDVMKVNQEGGEPYYIIKMDTKRTTDAGATQDGHYGGQCIVEFEVKKDAIDPLYNEYRGTPPHGDLNHPITSIENLGDYLELGITSQSSSMGSIEQIKSTIQSIEDILKDGITKDDIDDYLEQEYENLLNVMQSDIITKQQGIEDKYNAWNSSFTTRFTDFIKNNNLGSASTPFRNYDNFMEEAYGKGLDLVIEQSKLANEEAIKLVKRLQDQRELLVQMRNSADITADEQMRINQAISTLDEKIANADEIFTENSTKITEAAIAKINSADGNYINGLSYLSKINEKLLKQYEDATGTDKLDLENKIIENYTKQSDIQSTRIADAYNGIEALFGAEYNDFERTILDRFKVKEALDAEGEFNSNYSEIVSAVSQAYGAEGVEFYKRIASQYQQYVKIIKEGESVLYDISDTLDDFKADNSAKIDTYIKLQERICEILNTRLQKGEAIYDAKSALYDFQQQLKESVYSAEVELKANKELDKWLDPETRQYLFNDEDLSEYTSKIKTIQGEIQSDYQAYVNEINSLKPEEMYREAEITALWQQQLAVKKEQLEVAKDEMNIAKKTLEYNNTARERDTQIILGNRMVNVADPTKLYNIAKEKAEMENEASLRAFEHLNNADLRRTEAENLAIQTEANAIQNRIDMINEMTAKEREAWEKTLPSIDVMETMLASVSGAHMRWLNETVNDFMNIFVGLTPNDVGDLANVDSDNSELIAHIDELGLSPAVAHVVKNLLAYSREVETSTVKDVSKYDSGWMPDNYGNDSTDKQSWLQSISDNFDAITDYRSVMDEIIANANLTSGGLLSSDERGLLKRLESARNLKIHRNRLDYEQTDVWGGTRYDLLHLEDLRKHGMDVDGEATYIIQTDKGNVHSKIDENGILKYNLEQLSNLDDHPLLQGITSHGDIMSKLMPNGLLNDLFKPYIPTMPNGISNNNVKNNINHFHGDFVLSNPIGNPNDLLNSITNFVNTQTATTNNMSR